jgi:heptosyltransferase-2
VGALTLLVRLPNWVGDVCMALPSLTALEVAGFQPVLAGRGWAADLLGAHGWPTAALPGGLRDAAGAVRGLGCTRGLLLTNSLSSALAFRLGGVAALGHRGDGRSLLLGHALARPSGLHEVEVFWRLARETAVWLGADADAIPVAPPRRLGLRTTAAHDAAARSALAAALADPLPHYVVLAPLAAGSTRGASKRWPGFAGLARALAGHGLAVVCCPGPGEEPDARAAMPAEVAMLPGLGLGAYVAVCRGARLTVANDSGPMHLAAAIDAPVLGVFGPSAPARTRPWSPAARCLGGDGEWPAATTVIDTALAMIARGAGSDG